MADVENGRARVVSEGDRTTQVEGGEAQNWAPFVGEGREQRVRVVLGAGHEAVIG